MSWRQCRSEVAVRRSSPTRVSPVAVRWTWLSTNAGATNAPSRSMSCASGNWVRPTSSLPSQATTPSRTAIAVASGMAGLCTRPLNKRVVTYSGLRSTARGSTSSYVDDLAVDVITVPGRGVPPACGPRRGTRGDQRHPAGRQRGHQRPCRRTGGRQQQQRPDNRAGQAGNHDEDSAEGNQRAVGRRALDRGRAQAGPQSADVSVDLRTGQREPDDERREQQQYGPAEADRRRERHDDRELDDHVEQEQPLRHVGATFGVAPGFRKLAA